jgi:hypothetical protein
MGYPKEVAELVAKLESGEPCHDGAGTIALSKSGGFMRRHQKRHEVSYPGDKGAWVVNDIWGFDDHGVVVQHSVVVVDNSAFFGPDSIGDVCDSDLDADGLSD